MSEKFERAYEQVCRHARRIKVLSSIEATLDWDEQTTMPSAGTQHRAEQVTLLAGLVHQAWTDKPFVERLDRLADSGDLGEPHSNRSVTVLRLKRQADKKRKLPQSLVEELTRCSVIGQNAWREARKNNDFAHFRPHLEKTIELKRRQAEALGYDDCPYDALLDDFEPDMLTAEAARVLAELREHLVPLVGEIRQSGRQPDRSILTQSYPVDDQVRFGRMAAAAIGFDFQRGRLDVAAHPFCTELGPHDCRITTRYRENGFGDAFFSTLHEAGHGIYEQGLPSESYGLPLSESVSLGIHESQSRMWENLVGRSRAFWQFFFPQLQVAFPNALADVNLAAFHFAVNDVRPSLIRTEADEATYNLHILVRFELEQALLDGELAAADAPGAWNEKYRQYLDIVPDSDADGVLQDVHWSAGLIGYFPTYTLGNLYAAQFFAAAEAELGALDEQFAQGEFAPLREWLRKNIHQAGQRYSSAELVQRVSGKPLSHEPLLGHLRGKLGPLYELA